jgi:hypothetical protein
VKQNGHWPKGRHRFRTKKSEGYAAFGLGVFSTSAYHHDRVGAIEKGFCEGTANPTMGSPHYRP